MGWQWMGTPDHAHPLVPEDRGQPPVLQRPPEGPSFTLQVIHTHTVGQETEMDHRTY